MAWLPPPDATAAGGTATLLRVHPSDQQLAAARSSLARAAAVRLEDLELLTCVCRCAVHPAMAGGLADPAAHQRLRGYVSRLIGDNHAGITFQTVVARVTEGARGRSMDLMLALELQRQLGVLAVNAHPFYTPASFASSTEYGAWRQHEITRLRAVVEGLWQEGPLPEAHHDDYNGRHLHHATFGRLVQLCRIADRTLYGPAAAAKGFSPEARMLLEEYGMQFGVGDLFRTLVVLQSLASDVAPHSSWWYLRVGAMVSQLLRHLNGAAGGMACVAELALARQCAATVHAHARAVLLDLAGTFPAKQPSKQASIDGS